MQKFYEARDAVEAQLLRDHLAAHHIRSVVLGDYLSGAAGDLPAVNFPAVWLIEARDVPRARQLLESFLEGAPPGPDWRCPRCGAEVEGSFDLCWQCGLPRPDEDGR